MRISAQPRAPTPVQRSGSAPLAASPGAHELPEAYAESGAADEYIDGEFDDADNAFDDHNSDPRPPAAPEERVQRASPILTQILARNTAANPDHNPALFFFKP